MFILTPLFPIIPFELCFFQLNDFLMKSISIVLLFPLAKVFKFKGDFWSWNMGISCHALRCMKKCFLVDMQKEILLLDYFPFDVHDQQQPTQSCWFQSRQPAAKFGGMGGVVVGGVGGCVEPHILVVVCYDMHYLSPWWGITSCLGIHHFCCPLAAVAEAGPCFQGHLWWHSWESSSTGGWWAEIHPPKIGNFFLIWSH